MNKKEMRAIIRAQKRAMTEEQIVSASARLGEKFRACGGIGKGQLQHGVRTACKKRLGTRARLKDGRLAALRKATAHHADHGLVSLPFRLPEQAKMPLVQGVTFTYDAGTAQKRYEFLYAPIRPNRNQECGKHCGVLLAGGSG